MKKLLTALVLVGTSLGLVSCGGGGDSSDGGGSSMNLTGTWRIEPHSNSTIVIFRPSTATLQQTGNIISATKVIVEHGPGITCDTSENIIKGVVAGNTFNGSISSAVSSTSFSLSGTSSSLSGDFTVSYYSGPCVGTYNGTATMTRI